MAYLMGIDLGTSSLKVIVTDYQGKIKALSSRQYKFDSPYNGYAEQQPEFWWDICCKTIQEALYKNSLSADKIKSISFSGQMHGLVLLNRNKQVIRPAILHCDSRSEKQVKQINEIFGPDLVKELIMNPVYTGFLLPSLLWVRDNEPENYKKAGYVCLPKDYLRFKLTGEIASDYSDASATLAFDIKNNCWSEKILDKVNLPIEIFPPCYSIVSNVGVVTEKAAAETGLQAGTAVICGGGDQIMQNIGSGATSLDIATVNIGTSGQVCFQSDSPIINPKLNTNLFCGYKKGRWIIMGATMSAGLSLHLYSSLFREFNYDYINKQVKGIRPGSGGLVYLPYLNGERTPHINPNISGVLMGLNIRTDRARIARAIMEGVSYSLMQCIEVCGELGLSPKYLIASGGGAQSIPWLQIQADIYNLPLRVTTTGEQAGLGAVIAAGVGIGVFNNIEEGCQAIVKYKEDIIVPDEEKHKIYKEYYQLYKDIYNDCSNVLERVTELGRRP
jgi:xylulokinase